MVGNEPFSCIFFFIVFIVCAMPDDFSFIWLSVYVCGRGGCCGQVKKKKTQHPPRLCEVLSYS